MEMDGSIKACGSKRLRVSNNHLEKSNSMGESNSPQLNLPQEILVHIFSFYIKSEGISNLLMKVAKVNRAWEDAAKNFLLWPVIDDSNLSRDLLLNLKNQLSNTWKLNVCHLNDELSSNDMVSVLIYCPKLKVLQMRTKHLSSKFFAQLPQLCPLLESVTFQHVNIGEEDLDPLLEICGRSITYVDLSGSMFDDFECTMNKVATLCPNLEELHLMKIGGENKTFPFDVFQICCHKLKFLGLEGINFADKWSNNTPGFPELETFICHSMEETGPNDAVLTSILRSSTKLKILDVEDNYEVTCQFLYTVPSNHLETLRLPQADVDIYDVFGAVVKWKHSLRYLSLSLSNETHQFAILFNLVIGHSTCKLEGLDLSNSAVPLSIIDIVLRRCPELNYLDLTDCSELPIDKRGIYHSREKVEDLRQQLRKGYLTNRKCPM